MYKGQLEGFPQEVVDVMLDEQERQGKKRDVSVFEKGICNGGSEGGFTWYKSNEGYDFWWEVIINKNFELFFEKYPKKSTYPKVMLVSSMPITQKNKGFERVVFMEKCEHYFGCYKAKTLEEAERETLYCIWHHAIDIPDKPVKKEFTMEEIAKALGVRVEELKIVK